MFLIAALDPCGCRSRTGRIIVDVVFAIVLVFVAVTTLVIGLRRGTTASAERLPARARWMTRRTRLQLGGDRSDVLMSNHNDPQSPPVADGGTRGTQDD